MFLLTLLSPLLTPILAATIVQSNICTGLPTAPTIDQPADASQTTQAEAIVSGTAQPSISITVLDNGQPLASTTSDAAGDFSVSVLLTQAQNVLIARASDPCGNTTDSSPATITYTPPPTPSSPPSQGTTPQQGTATGSSTSPSGVASPGSQQQVVAGAGPLVLTIISPKHFTTSGRAFILQGTTNIPATVTVEVNDRQVAKLYTNTTVNSFQTLVPLSVGENTITIAATATQYTASARLHVTRVSSATAAAHQPGFWSSHGKLVVIPVGIAIVPAAIYFFRFRHGKLP